MKKSNMVLKQIIPVICILIITMGLFMHVYYRMLDIEAEHSWSDLKTATNDAADWINTSFKDNMNLLDSVADAAALQINSSDTEDLLVYLTSLQVSTGTLFDRIDVLYPDGTLLMQDGSTVQFQGPDSFDDIIARGVHVSRRAVDVQTGRMVICCSAPIMIDGEAAASLLGVIDCNKLGEIFISHAYDGEAQVFIVDCADGNYLMDKWHPELGNIFEMGSRTLLEGYEDIDLAESISNGEEFSVAFISQTNNLAIYMYTIPLGDLSWSVSVMAQEDKIFANVNVMRDMMIRIGFGILVLLFAYLAINVLIVAASAKNAEKARQAEIERATNEAKSAFLSTVSHDIRTPLNGIVGMLDILERHKDEEGRLEDCLGKIRISTQFLLSLTNDVMDINEIESGKLQIAYKPINLPKFIEELDTLVQPRAKEKGITYTSDCSGVLNASVMSSDIYLNRILVNLVINSIKYNKKNGEVHLKVEELREKSGMYRFTVRDTGIGISEEFQDKIFDVFEQEVSDSRTTYSGHGLGLSIVKSLVTKMGGTITLESKKNVGSVFTVELPMEPAEAAEADNSSAVCDIRGLRILLVEDNALNMEIATVLLSDSGAVITEAENGRVAVEMFEASEPDSFDLILMDIMMPEMNGLEATRAIRAMNRADAKNVPIIAMTANAFSEDARKSIEAGMNEHITKPLNIELLVAAIAKAVK